MAFHGRIDSWSTRDLKRLQALRQPVAASGSICSGFVNRWSGVQISHPAPVMAKRENALLYNSLEEGVLQAQVQFVLRPVWRLCSRGVPCKPGC